jgi:enamine deaminase RidA (YjgF/YER057c/UK114 family)
MAEGRNTPAGRVAVVPSHWSDFYEETRIPAAIRAGGTVHVTGHTGEAADGIFPEGFEEQIRGTFANLGETLAEAGVGWPQVVSLTSYHVGLQRQLAALLRVAAEIFDEPLPAWTAVGVTELIVPEALVEISCVAVVPEPDGSPPAA